MADWLMIRPCFDEATEYTFQEGQDVLDYFAEKEVICIDLAKEQANKEMVKAVLAAHANVNIAHFDHGNEDNWIDNDGQSCMSCETAECLKGRECYCNNCSSAKNLGVEAFKKGAAAYWGYTNLFVFTTDAIEEFKEFVNHGIKRRVDGLTWKQCLELTKELAEKLINLLLQAGKALAASCLRWNCDHLVCYTEDMPPSTDQTDCPFRKLAIRLFGPQRGWHLRAIFLL